MQSILHFSLQFGMHLAGRQVPAYAGECAGGILMAEWFDQAADKSKKQEDSEETKTKRATQVREIMQVQGPRLWLNLREWMGSQIKKFNDKAGREVLICPITQNNKLSVFAKSDSGQRDINIVFDEVSHMVSYKAQAHGTGMAEKTGGWTMKVTPQDDVAFGSPTGIELSLDQVGAMILDALMGWK